jgi:hypothetical protein
MMVLWTKRLNIQNADTKIPMGSERILEINLNNNTPVATFRAAMIIRSTLSGRMMSYRASAKIGIHMNNQSGW